MLSPHGIKAAKATIPRRACFRYAQLSGLKALDDAAMNAINSLTLEVFNMKLRKRLPLQEVYMPPRSMEEINAEVMKCAETEQLEAGDVEILSMYKLRGFGKKKEKPQ